MKKKKMTFQEKLEINTEVKEFITYFCNLLETAKMEEEARQTSMLASYKSEEGSHEQTSSVDDACKLEYIVRDSLNVRSSVLSRKYEIICSLLPSRLSSQDFLLTKSNLTEEGEAILELYKRLREGGMENIEKEMEASTRTRKSEVSKEPQKKSSDLRSLKQKRLQREMSALNEKLLAEEKRKLHVASTLTAKDLLQQTKESLVEPSEKYPKPRPSERTPIYEVCKKRLRKRGLPTTEQVCRSSAEKDADDKELEIDDDVYRFIEDEEKVLHAYNIWMKSYFGYHRKSVRNRFKERVIKTIKTINLDSDDDENYFTTESSEGSAIADSSCDSLDDEEEHKIKEIFLKEDINHMMLTLEDKIRKERTPLAGMELKNHELKMMCEDSSIETSSDESEEKYDDSADPTVDLQEILEKEKTIIPNLELTINHLLDEKINHSKSLYELYHNMVNLSVKKEQIRQKLLNESDWQLEKGAFLSGVEYLKENSSVEGDKSMEKALVNSQYDIIKNMSEQDNSLVMHLMEADHKMRQAAEERLENEEEFRKKKELMHEYEEKIRVKVAKLRDLIRKKIHKRLNKLLGKRQKYKQYKDSDSVCSFNSESIDTTLTDVTKEIAFLQSFNEELEREDTRTSDKLYKALTRKCAKFKEKFEKKAAQVEIVYSSHSEDDELYKDDKYRDQIRLPEEYEKKLHNVIHNISVRYDDSTIRARIKRYKQLLHLRKRYLNIPCIKKYLASSFIPEHLKTMLKQMKKRNLFSMNLEHTAYAMTISLKRIFQQKMQTRKRKRESSHDYIAESLLETEKGVNIYAVTTSDTTTSGMDEYKDETQSFLEDIHYNWDRFQMKYFRDKKLQLIKQLTHSTEDIAKPRENFDLITELKTKRGKLKSYEIVNALELKEEWERRNKNLLKEKKLQCKREMQDAERETDKESRDMKSLGIEEKLILPMPGTEKELASAQPLDPDLILISEFDACVKRKDFQKEYMKFVEEKSKVCYGTDVNERDEELMLVGKESEMMIVSDQEGVRRFSERLFEEKMLLLLTKGKYTLHQIKMKPYLKYYIKLWKLHTKMYNDAIKYDDAMINGKFIGILNPDKFERFKRMQTLFLEPKETFWITDEQREYEKFECELSPTSPVELDSSKQDESMLISAENSQSFKESLTEEEEEEEDSRELEQEVAHQLKSKAIPCLKDEPHKVTLTQDKIKKQKNYKTSALGCQQVRNVGPLITLIKKSRNLRSRHWTYPERKFLKSFLCKRDHFSSVKLAKPCYGLLKNDKEFHTADVILYKMLKLMKDPLKKFINEAYVPDQKNSEESTDTDEEVLQFLGKTSFNEVTWEDIEKNFLREFIASRGFLLGKQEMLTTEEGCKDKQMYDIRRFLYQDLLHRVPRKREQICPVEAKRAISEATPPVDEFDLEKYKVSTPPKPALLSDEEIMFEQDAKEMELQKKKKPSAFYKQLFSYRTPVAEDPIKLARKESVLIPKEELGLPRFNFSIPFKIKSSPEMLPPRAPRVHH